MASAVEIKNLSENDNSVLMALFDSEASLASPAVKICETKEPTLPTFDTHQIRDLQLQEAKILKPLNEPQPLRQEIEKAITDLSELVKAFPEYPSAYANRAQARRLLFEEAEADRDDPKYDPAKIPAISARLADLSKAISLATPEHPTASVSTLQAQILAKAHTHRAYLLHKLAKRESGQQVIGALGLGDIESLEDMASRDFYLGGTYGNDVARQMSVLTNPYAKLCGAIVKEALMDDIAKSLI